MFNNTQMQMINMKLSGVGSRKIAKQFGVSKTTVNNVYNRYISAERGDDVVVEQKGAKVLFLDLEVSASIVAAFSMFKHFSTPDHVIQFPYVLTYAANWLHNDIDDIECYGLHDFNSFELDHRDDFELMLRLWTLLDKADIVVGQNIMRFDNGWLNQRFAYHNLPKPSPYRLVDTMLGMKKAMALPSNSLDYSTKYFELGHNKLKHDGIKLWIDCMDGCTLALDSMKKYNYGDIPTLRELYLKIRQFIPNHPNVALFFGDEDDKMRCNVCGSDHLTLLEGKAYTNLSVFDAYRCGGCGAVSRSGTSNTTSKQRKNLLRNITH